MRKTITTLCLLVIASVNYVNAQTSAGNMMLGGSIEFQSRKDQADEDYNYSRIAFQPSFGYFIAENFAVGAGIGVGKTTTDDTNQKREETFFTFGPFARYYIPTSGDNLKFFAQAGFDFGTGKTDVTPGGEVKSGSFGFYISPGLAYFLNQHWALELAFTGFQIESVDPDKDNDDDKRTDVTFGIESFSPSIGVRYHFGN